MNDDKEKLGTESTPTPDKPIVPQFPTGRIELNEIPEIPSFPVDRIEKGEKPGDMNKTDN